MLVLHAHNESMFTFLLEYLHFGIAVFAVLVSISAMLLFGYLYKTEQRLRSPWRAIGFGLLAAAFLFAILERQFGVLQSFSVLLELAAFASIYRGMRSELFISDLREVSTKTPKRSAASMIRGLKNAPKSPFFQSILHDWVTLVGFGVFLLASIVSIGISSSPINHWLLIVASLASMGCLFAAVLLQARRFRAESSTTEIRWNNLFPLLAYVCLILRQGLHIAALVPLYQFVVFHKFSQNFSSVWTINLLATFLAFFFLILWTWPYIRSRMFIRLYVLLIGFAVILSTLGSLVFIYLSFGLIQDTHIGLMMRGAQSERVILSERANTAVFLAKTVAEDEKVVQAISANNEEVLATMLSDRLALSNADSIRAYDTHGVVIADSADPREVGRLYNDDALVANAVLRHVQIRSFDLQPGVLAPTLVARGLYPVFVGDQVIGVIEVDYAFDTAFVDFSKREVGLDVTVYVGDTRSATTLLGPDGVSRWVGSKEENPAVLSNVLKHHESYAGAVNQLGTNYYNAYIPVKDANGRTVGMVSVGTPVEELITNARQQLLTAFLLLMGVSLLAVFLMHWLISQVIRKR